MKSIKAFTLIELLIVIVIIGILAVALIPRLTGAQARARDTARRADIRQIQTAFAQYAAENNGNYPLSTPKCLGLGDNESCWLGYTRRAPNNTSGFSGSDSLNTMLKQYLMSIPSDPGVGRAVGDRYIYYYSLNHTAIHCNSAEYLSGKAFIAWQPEKVSPNTNDQCAPGKFACCGPLGCTSFTQTINFCVLQLD